MPANKKQHTTPTSNPTAGESSSSQHLVQQTFHQHLREQIRSATQRVMEEIMCEELTQFLGAEWGECCAERKGYPEAVRSLSEDEEHLLTFYAFPQVMHRYIRNTNAIESLFRNVRRRTNQIDTFTGVKPVV